MDSKNQQIVLISVAIVGVVSSIYLYVKNRELENELKECSDSNKGKCCIINNSIRKEDAKVVDKCSIKDIEGLGKDNVAYCRCWKSKSWPYCDGAHGKHNQESGDNLGPLVITK